MEAERGMEVGPDVETTDLVEYAEGRLGLSSTPTWDEAVAQTRTLDRIGRNIAVWWGDWMNYIEDIFPERWAQLIPDTGWAPKTLMNWKWVCRRVTSDIRRLDVLTFDHLSSIAKFEPDVQDSWLLQAEEGGWSAQRLRQELKSTPKEKELKVYRFPCQECGHEMEITKDDLK